MYLTPNDTNYIFIRFRLEYSGVNQDEVSRLFDEAKALLGNLAHYIAGRSYECDDLVATMIALYKTKGRSS